MNGAEGTTQAGPGKWLAARWRLWLTIFLLSALGMLSRCGPATAPVTSSPTPEGAPGSVRIDVRPHGAQVSIDGLRSGTTPLSAELSAGSHTVEVQAPGYEPLVQVVDLGAGEEVVLEGQLAPLTKTPASEVMPTSTLRPTATPPNGRDLPSSLPDLLVERARIEIEEPGPCTTGPAPLGLRAVVANRGEADAGPFVVQINDSRVQVPQGLPAGEMVEVWAAGYAAGSENRVVVDVDAHVEESDEDNNVFAQMVPIPTPIVTCTPAPAEPATGSPPPTSTPAAASFVNVREGQFTIATYPYTNFLQQARNETYNVTYQVLDRPAYEASNPMPVQVTYRTLIVENPYLQLTFLPDLGGRLYQVVYKPSGHNLTYRNPVLKPSPWGPAEQGWWLAAGGIEWCLPVEEHGYEWGVPWQISTRPDEQGVTVLLRDSEAADRVRAEIAVRLEADAAAFTIRPRLENPTGAPRAVKYWTNAMLAPGGANAPSADLRFVLPAAVETVTIHSRGDDDLPAYDEPMSWPLFGGQDMSRLGNWNRWLGFFEDPARGEFLAVYDEGYDEGMVRVFDPDVARGAKVFAFGWTDPIAADNWTDDGSGYVEIHGGPAPTFDDSVTLPAGGSLQWTETWYPVAGLGRLCFANTVAALSLSAGGGQAKVGVAVPRPWSGRLLLLLDGQELWRQVVDLQPAQAFRATVPLDDGVPATNLILRLEGADGQAVAQVRAGECAPGPDQGPD